MGSLALGSFASAAVEAERCMTADRCETRRDDCRCTVHGECVEDVGHTCFEIKECTMDGVWVHYTCHYSTMGYPQCPSASVLKDEKEKKDME
jgi:hypothetical protein